MPIILPSPNQNERLDKTTQSLVLPHILTLHYTAIPLAETLAKFTQDDETSGVSAHYTISEQGALYQHVDPNKRAWHAGLSHWGGIENINSYAIGVENVNLGYAYNSLPALPDFTLPATAQGQQLAALKRVDWQTFQLERCQLDKTSQPKLWFPYPEAQIKTLSDLCAGLIEDYQITPQNVVGHSDVAPNRKLDPGPLFPWQQLADAGIGAWPDTTRCRPDSTMPSTVSVPWMQEHLKKWGYNPPQTGVQDPPTQAILRAFQMHYRPEKFDGVLDLDTQTRLDALLQEPKNFSYTPKSSVSCGKV